MGSVIDFTSAKKKASKKHNVLHCPPIKVKRIGLGAIVVGFDADCFSSINVNNALNDTFRCQGFWRIEKAELAYKENSEQGFYSYVVYVPKPDTAKIDDSLRQALYLMAVTTYREESRLKSASSHFVDDMSNPRKDGLAEGLYVETQTIRKLKEASIFTIYDVVSHTREELCNIPGMTTREVYKIEKTLHLLDGA